MKVLNLYAGIGGNRKLWGDEHEITAVEIDPNIAEIYKTLYPNDTVIVDDAHEYLRRHFREFDFIWASPPCPTHSQMQMFRYYSPDLKYPDVTLYQEIILLDKFYHGDWVIENVIPHYSPLIKPAFKIGRHCYWSNKIIESNLKSENFMKNKDSIFKLAELYGFDITKLKNVNKQRVLRNCVVPEIGKYIFEEITRGIE